MMFLILKAIPLRTGELLIIKGNIKSMFYGKRGKAIQWKTDFLTAKYPNATIVNLDKDLSQN